MSLQRCPQCDYAIERDFCDDERGRLIEEPSSCMRCGWSEPQADLGFVENEDFYVEDFP